MIVCPTCGERHLTGTLFCLECGTYLADPTSAQPWHQPAPVREEDFSPVTDDAVAPEPDTKQPVHPGREVHVPQYGQPAKPPTAPGKGASPVRVRLLVPASQRMVTFSLAHEITLGRTDTKRGVHPDLDLSPDGGLDAGVSRLHAAIRPENGAVVIVDLASSNGTLVNGVELVPNLPQPLHDGDEIELGALRLTVYIED